MHCVTKPSPWLTVLAALAADLTLLSTCGSSQCTPLADEEPRSRSLQCNETHPCTRFRAASGRGGGGTGVNCNHGCATEFAEVGACVAHLVVTDDLLPGVWRSCNKTVAVLDIFPREQYPPTCSGQPIKTVVYPTDATCRVFDNATMPIGPVGDGQYWQMDCLTSYYEWIPPQLMAVGTSPTGAVSIFGLNYTTAEMQQLYEYNSSIGAAPAAATNPTDPNDGMLYFAAFDQATKHSKVVSYEPRANFGDWSFPTTVEQPFEILSLMFYRPSIFGCDYESPNCGVWVLAAHGDPDARDQGGYRLDVGEILHTGLYNVTSPPFPAGNPTKASAYNWDAGNPRANPPDPAAFFLQMEALDGSLQIVRCSLPDGEVVSTPLDPGYKIVAMEFARGGLAAVFTKTSGSARVRTPAEATPTYFIGMVARNNGSVTEAGSFTPSKPGYSMLPGVSVLTPGESGMGTAALNVVLASETAGDDYELVQLDPLSGAVLQRAMLANPSMATVVQLGYA